MAADLDDDLRRLLVDLEGARGCISGAVIDYRMPCTATEDTTCQIVHHLAIWNEFFRCLNLQLIELTESGRQLGLVGVRNNYYTCTNEERDQASTLLYWLLQTHRCVATLYVTSEIIQGKYSQNRRELLWRALDGKASLKSLTFQSYLDLWKEEDEQQECADFCKALLSLSGLEELDLYVTEWDGLVSAMCTILRKTTKLRVLNLFNTGLYFECEALLWALRANSTLRHLSLPSHMIYTHSYSFLKFMAASATLQRLSVLNENIFDRRHNDLRWVFKGMLKNPAISVLEVENYCFDSGSTRMAARMLRENRNLKSLKLSWSFFLDPDDRPLLETPADVALLHDALSQNSTLEHLTLCIHVWSVDQWRPFFSVASKHGSLKMVTIEAVDRLYCLMHGVVQQLELSGIEQKVCFRASCSIESLLASDCRRCSSLEVCLAHRRYGETYYNGGILLPVLQQLPTLTHLTVSSVALERECRAKFSAITDYIATTSTLKNLSLQYQECHQETGPSLCSLLSQSLLLNTSITELGFGQSGDPCDGLALLGDVVRQSVVLRRINFFGWYVLPYSLFVQRLLVDVSRYDALCGVTWRSESLSEWIDSWTIRYCAAGLERVYRNPALLTELAEVLSIDEAEARERVRQRVRSIEGLQDFMRLAGVVKECVTCLPSEDGSTQLDALNEDCWSHVRRYLQLSDLLLGSASQ
ncbi:hypothetical protein HPB51_021632 [Rhipicephalus microplus]|uniref:Uncharacterized protein n=1 Tax=Rhipicephalus microplus TaxID=6941 RepID=A0A9J6EUB9_RHIMP|nr:hypothetical protein HPB51_021632 [Rhipicephalus microplus]